MYPLYEICRMNESPEDRGRRLVVAEAMTWLRTPHHHAARVKGVGVDCAMFPLEVYVRCGMIEPPEIPPYPRDWHVHMREERYIPVVEQFAREITEPDLKAGDLVLFKLGRVYSHGALVTKWPQCIHAWKPAGMVILDDLDGNIQLVTAERRYFTLKEWPNGR